MQIYSNHRIFICLQFFTSATFVKIVLVECGYLNYTFQIKIA